MSKAANVKARGGRRGGPGPLAVRAALTGSERGTRHRRVGGPAQRALRRAGMALGRGGRVESLGPAEPKPFCQCFFSGRRLR